MRVVVFGTFDERRHPRVRVLREGFADHGDEVLLCNEPVGLDTAARVALLRAPWRAPRAALRLAVTWGRLRRRARRLPAPDVVVVGYLGHLDVHLARRLWPAATIVLDHLVSLRATALDRRAGSGWLLRVLASIDRRALRAADLILVDTAEHLADLPAEARDRAMVVPVGAPHAWFRAPEPPPEESPLRAIFFGLYTPLQGAPVIGEAIARLAGEPVAFTMVGHGQDLPATRAAARANDAAVTWRDWTEPEALIELVASHDVCLGIFGAGPKGVRVVPNKVFQGAAAGCAIVTSDTPPQRRALVDAALLVPPGDPDALAEGLRALAGDRERLAALRKAAAHRAEEAFRPAQVTEALRARLAATPAATHGRLPALSPNAWLRHDLIFDALRAAGARSVLEVGAGAGAMGARLARRFDYTGVEPDPVSYQTARRRIGVTGTILQGGIERLPADSRFDAVCAFEVLEHIADDAAALRDWYERVRPGGIVLLSVPAFQRRFAAADRAAGHVRRYDRAVLAARLRDAGFADVAIWTYGFGLGYVLERGRNILAARDERRGAAAGDLQTATGASGRWHQPPESAGGLIRVATAPFRALQRPFRGTPYGTGLVARARRPS